MYWVELSVAVASLVVGWKPVIGQPLVDVLVQEVEVVILELVSQAVVVDSLVALGFAVELLELVVEGRHHTADGTSWLPFCGSVKTFCSRTVSAF